MTACRYAGEPVEETKRAAMRYTPRYPRAYSDENFCKRRAVVAYMFTQNVLCFSLSRSVASGRSAFRLPVVHAHREEKNEKGGTEEGRGEGRRIEGIGKRRAQRQQEQEKHTCQRQTE